MWMLKSRKELPLLFQVNVYTLNVILPDQNDTHLTKSNKVLCEVILMFNHIVKELVGTNVSFCHDQLQIKIF